MTKAVFLDKDGTLIENVPYNVDPGKIKLYPGAGLALRRLQEQGFKIIVVSNQSGVGRGLFEESALNVVWKEIAAKLMEYRVAIDNFYYCPHYKEGNIEGLNIECDCRKPLPGMLEKAAREHDIDLKQSWMIGDILNDVEAGNRAGCKTILINNGNETEWQNGAFRTPDFFATSILESAIIIDNNLNWNKPESKRKKALATDPFEMA
ncbi:MAG TPA: HAD family hydrolase [Cytophagales bacterium]|nr:HAD family hydrolase [Cytophagales bacterium]